MNMVVLGQTIIQRPLHPIGIYARLDSDEVESALL